MCLEYNLVLSCLLFSFSPLHCLSFCLVKTVSQLRPFVNEVRCTSSKDLVLQCSIPYRSTGSTLATLLLVQHPC